MSHRLVSVLIASGACCVLAACVNHDGPAPAERSSAPPAQRPLLGPPDPGGPTTRGIFLEDPAGQVEVVAAGGHLVAWSVRTPADPLPDDDDVMGDVLPKRLPTSTKVVIVDERGGKPIAVDLGRRWVSRLRMIRGAGGPAEPRLAVESCTSRARSTCQAELLTLTPGAPLKVTARAGGTAASAAVNGFLDSGRRLVVAGRTRASCAPRLSVRELVGGSTRALPPLPTHDREYPRCQGLTSRWLVGHYAFAEVRRSAPRYHFEADFVYGIDLTAGPSARWRQVYRPYRYTDGSTGLAIGPAVTDRALYWEETNEEPDDGSIYSLEQVALPRDVQHDRTAGTPTTADPIAPRAPNACDIAATDDAIYELANPRCTIGHGVGKSGEIRRIVNPTFQPYEG